ncbi:MAG: hypothetical protein U0401_12615 [Anaerolineae bacterium]
MAGPIHAHRRPFKLDLPPAAIGAEADHFCRLAGFKQSKNGITYAWPAPHIQIGGRSQAG